MDTHQCIKCEDTPKKRLIRQLCPKCYPYTRRRENPSVFAAYANSHRKLIRERNKEWAKAHPHKRAAAEAKRRALKLKCTPPWADLTTIQKIYELCPIGHEVDHIVPLNHKNVCGLHIPCNLQYLSSVENAKKKNRFDGTSTNDGWRQ